MCAPEHARRLAAFILRGLEEITRNVPTFAVNIAFIFSPSPLGDTRSCHIRPFPSFTVSTFTRATAKQSTCTCPKEPTPTYGHPSKEESITHPLSGKEPSPAYGHPSKLRGVFRIPSLEGCRVSGGVGCPQPGRLRLAQDHPLRLGSGQISSEGITYKVTLYA